MGGFLERVGDKRRARKSFLRMLSHAAGEALFTRKGSRLDRIVILDQIMSTDRIQCELVVLRNVFNFKKCNSTDITPCNVTGKPAVPADTSFS